MKPYDDFLPWVLPDVGGCPEITAISAIRDTAIQFCEFTLIHQADHASVSVIENSSEYELESPVQQTRVFKIMRAWYKGNLLTPAAPDMIMDPAVYNSSIGGYSPHKSTPRYFTQKDPLTFSLMPIPDQTLADAITMRVALVPLRNSTSCEDFLFENWVEAIADGAVARLQSMIGRPFANAVAAPVHQNRFLSEINRARLQANRGLTRGNLMVQMRSA